MSTADNSFAAIETTANIEPALIGVDLPPEQFPTDAYGYNPDLWLYRERTVGLLKRYLRMSIEVGRLPSLLGREFFRARVTSYQVGTFEDAVIFVHDVESSFETLDDFEKKLISTIVFQDLTHDEAAEDIGCWRRTVGRRFPEALDKLSNFFLEGGLLHRFPKTESMPEKSCQEGETDEICVSDSEDSK